MKIAQVAPLFETVPPLNYGGTERVVSQLTEELVSRGHAVTLFAARGSLTSAKLIESAFLPLRLNPIVDTVLPHILQLEEVRRLSKEFDVIHFHHEYLHYSFIRSLETPTVTTMHLRMDTPNYDKLYSEYSDIPLVAISNSQRQQLPTANWQKVIRHGLQLPDLEFHPSHSGYLAFLGRLSPEKGFEDAVEIARRCGRRLRVAAKMEYAHNPEYSKRIEPLLSLPFVEYLGEINDKEKNDFLGSAAALLFPIRWPEPFGLVMIESLATGTPVVAFNRGSVPEIIRSGVTGFIVNDVEDACRAVEEIETLERENCRREYLCRFSRGRMTDEYLHVFESLIEKKDHLPPKKITQGHHRRLH